MKILFVNPSQVRCGVHQYGLRFYALLKNHTTMDCFYVESSGNISSSIHSGNWDAVIYNVHPGISNICSVAPLPIKALQVAIYHDGTQRDDFDAWLFSNGQTGTSGKTHFIGRPLPQWEPVPHVIPRDRRHRLTVGLSGFGGAWATTMIGHVINQIPDAKIRLALPPADHVDPNGESAFYHGSSCAAMLPKDQIEVTYEFVSEPKLLEWLSQNDVNCYIRPHLGSNGISSALDLALAVRRPIYINRHQMFRHLHDCRPSICLEDVGLPELISNGLEPLIPHYYRHDPKAVAGEVEKILLSLHLSKSG